MIHDVPSQFKCTTINAGSSRRRQSNRRLIYDYDAFEINAEGELIFTRILPAKSEPITNYCIDSTTVTKQKKPETSYHMAAVFCHSGEFDEKLVDITDPISGQASVHGLGVLSLLLSALGTFVQSLRTRKVP